MDARGRVGDAGVVSRVVITGEQPQHLSRAQADAWLRSELANLRALPDVESIVLTHVHVPRGQARPWAWLCELHLADGADGGACVEHPLCTEWLMDLRLLGMHPAVAVLDAGERVI